MKKNINLKIPKLNQLSFCSEQLPSQFDGYRIVQLSDLHGSIFGYDHAALIRIIKKAHPDIVIMTGDMITSFSSLRALTALLLQLTPLYPVYYVCGNHEAQTNHYREIHTAIKQCGVITLDKSEVAITRDGAAISICGMPDPYRFFSRRWHRHDLSASILFQKQLHSFAQRTQTDRFRILLSHRPEFFPTYANCGFDLVFSGHAHGGLIRFGKRCGLYAPHQGFFPKYTSGLYAYKNTHMVVSRGLGDSAHSHRINNGPEVLVTVLHTL